MVCSDGFVWVVDGFIVLNLWWVVDGFVAESDGFVVVIWGPSRINHWFVIWGQWVCDLGWWVGIWVGVVGWINFW